MPFSRGELLAALSAPALAVRDVRRGADGRGDRAGGWRDPDGRQLVAGRDPSFGADAGDRVQHLRAGGGVAEGIWIMFGSNSLRAGK